VGVGRKLLISRGISSFRKSVETTVHSGIDEQLEFGGFALGVLSSQPHPCETHHHPQADIFFFDDPLAPLLNSVGLFPSLEEVPGDGEGPVNDPFGAFVFVGVLLWGVWGWEFEGRDG
jgi:hypothetical protein